MPIVAKVAGKEYIGEYRIQGKAPVITVRCAYGAMSTRLEGMPPESIAWLLISKMESQEQTGRSSPPRPRSLGCVN
jgi:hypothetical protein